MSATSGVPAESGTGAAAVPDAFDGLRRAMADNLARPEGPARNARAEALLAEAEQLGVAPAVIEALNHQLQVYNYSSEKAKMFVPFARLLRMWDERPEDFDAYETHTLHWVFKWMTAGMLGQPHIPLASIEKWLGEMEHRYRLAGHSERAVRSAEFSVARHVGDRPRAQRAFDAWLAADRDAMSDCPACELHDQGLWHAYQEDDAEALALWRPVLDGEHRCAHEPHAVLASSLLPLLRLGRADEARAHHLRGLRLVRQMESMRGAFAEHVEFCALTGNEARALELLAERPAYFTDSGHPPSLMNFLAVTALLMDRLTALGLGDRPVPGPQGRAWTARELAAHARGGALDLAARFDARNGTARTRTELVARMDRAPLLDRLPLGVRSPRPLVAPGPAAVPAAPAPRTAAPAELLAKARRASEALRPDAVRAWAALARAAECADGPTGAELTAADRAAIADHEGMDPRTPAADSVACFERAAALYAEAGDPDEALAARARAACALALTGRTAQALDLVADPCERLVARCEAGGTGARAAGSALAGRLRILLERVRRVAADPTAEAVPLERACAEAEDAARRLIGFADPYRGQPPLAARVAEGHGALGELAACRGDAAAATELYGRCAREFVAAGLPWFAVEYESRLAALAARLCDHATAERAARAAVEHGAPYVAPARLAGLHLQLADVLADAGELSGAAEHARHAAHWADEAGGEAEFGAWARYRLGGFLLRLGHAQEAAEVLESALLDLSEEAHGDGPIVQTRWWLGDCLTQLGLHREAAEHWLHAAETAAGWPEQRDHAMLAHLAAEALGRAELPQQADRAYQRAGELWRALGQVHGVVRALRARAWLAVRDEPAGALGDAQERPGLGTARELMSEALSACESAAAGALVPDERRHFLAELGDTHRQFGDLLHDACSGEPGAHDAAATRTYEDALTHMECAVAHFAGAGAEVRGSRTGAQLRAGWLEAALDRPRAAAARARAVLAEYDAAPGPAADGAPARPPEAAVRREEAARLLAAVGR